MVETVRRKVGSRVRGDNGTGAAPLKGEGTMTGRTLGGFWVINEIKVSMMGTTVTGMQTIGFDPAKKKYVGTWVDSMSNHMWNYEGTIDKTGKKLILEAEGPNVMAKGKRSKFRDTYEFQSADKILATSLIQMEDGKWVAFMTATMRRKKEK